jgi:D-alanyl-D-alanine carboxypeptidase/D-alanyl-D-alanine-endopeptidase (penicillin-binding protein 4)
MALRLFAGLFPTDCAPGTQLLFTCTLALTIFGRVAAADLSNDLRRLIEKSGLGPGSVSVSVLDAASGDAILEHRASAPMIPASNAKLTTTAAALDILGPSFEFRTRAELEETPQGGRLRIIGSGDPALGDPALVARAPELAVDRVAAQWIEGLRAAGVTRLSEIVVDDRVFDRDPIPAGWPTEQYGNGYCCETWGLNAHLNTIGIVAMRNGGTVGIETTPDYGLRVVRNTASLRTGAKFSVAIARPPASNDLTVRGNLDRERSAPLELTVHDTPSLFASLLERACESAGIPVDAARRADDHEAAPQGRTIEPVLATPIITILERANTDSENLYAESLFKRIGREHALAGSATPTAVRGSWANGRSATRDVLARRIGTERTAAWTIADGSGLSRDNRVTAGGMTALLASLARDPALAPTYFGSFAIAGKTGTVRRRFEGLGSSPVEVRCKTGYIRGVSCLSGLAVAPDGRAIAFAVLGNGLEAGDRVARAKALQEAVVRRIVAELEPSAAPDAKSR